MFLFYYFSLDLSVQPYRYRAFLDRISLSGFLRSRFYRTERLALAQQDLILKGISVPSYDVSAMAVRNVMRYWLKYPTPMFRILRGNLQEFFISHIERKLRALGCDIQLGQRLERITIEGGRVNRLFFRGSNGASREVNVETLILAIPAEKVVKLLSDEVYTVAPNMFNVRYLRTRAMAALNVYLRRKIVGLPSAHLNLVDSRYGLSLIDVSQTWSGYDGAVLNVIASDFTPLESVSLERARDEIMAEMRRYLPGLEADNVKAVDFQPHVEEPLFMNDVGAWQFRPDTRSQLRNLYFAGDYCRSHIDLLSMEGAVTTGLLAAEAIRLDAGVQQPVRIMEPQTYPRWLLLLAKYALTPLAVAAKLWILVSQSAKPAPPVAAPAFPMMSASRVRR